jgi:hypothetical protein
MIGLGRCALIPFFGFFPFVKSTALSVPLKLR